MILALRLAQMAADKPFWHDEILSLAVAEVPLSQAWEAMTSGFEFNPPLTYLVIRALDGTIGQGELFTRLPFLLAGLVSCVLVYRYFSCAGQRWRGLLAACLYVQSGAAEYFIDARSYSFVLMGLCFALVGWRQRAVLEERTWLPLAFFGFGMFTMTLAHFWSLGILLVFGVTELARAVMSRRVDWGMLLVFAIAALPVLKYPILLSAFESYALQFGAYRHTLYGSYLQIIGWSLLSVAWAGIPVVIHRVLSGRMHEINWPRLSAPEQVLLVSFAVLPIIIYLATLAMGGFFMGRYAVWTCIPIVFVAAILLDEVTKGYWHYRYYSLFVLMLGWAVFTTTNSGRPGYQNEVDWQTLNLDALEEDLDVVIGSGMHFLSLHYYASDRLKPRLFKVADPELAWTLLGSGMEDGAMILGAPYLNVGANILRTSEFRSRGEPFYFVDYPGWLQKTDWFSLAEKEAVEGFPLVYRITLYGSAQ